MKRIGIFGGTFSPPHNGHIAAALAFARTLALDEVLLMPTFVPPHKQKSDTVDASVRLHLLQLACNAVAPSPLSPCDFEIKKGDVSYTYETLEAFSAPDRELYFLCGTDMFLTLPIWREAARIFSLATIVCMRRECDPALSILLSSAEKDYKKRFGARVCFLDEPPVQISSSQIRELIATDDPSARDYLAPAVYAYSKANGMYRQRDMLTAFVKDHIDGYRWRHTCSVAEECERLAYLFGLSFADRARLHKAAMLHDVTKQLTTEEQVALLKRYGEEATPEELASPKTLHARTGALLVRHTCPVTIDDGICRAIAVHTIGDTQMSLFDWLLYLADYIEPLRTFPDCVKLRELFYGGIQAGRDKYRVLYEVLLLSFDMTIDALRAEGAPIHPTTLAVQAALRASSEDLLCARPSDCF